MRKIVAAAFSAAFIMSIATAASACPYMDKSTKETVKETKPLSTTS